MVSTRCGDGRALVDEGIGSGDARRDGERRRGVGGVDDDRGRRDALLEPLADGQPVAAGKVVVEDDDVRPRSLEPLDERVGVLRGGDEREAVGALDEPLQARPARRDGRQGRRRGSCRRGWRRAAGAGMEWGLHPVAIATGTRAGRARGGSRSA